MPHAAFWRRRQYFCNMRFQKIIDHKWWAAPDRYLAADCSSFTEEIS